MNLLLQGAQAVADIAQAYTPAPAPEPITMSLWDLFLSGGFLMWVLLGLGIIAVYLFFDRFWVIRKASKIDPNFMNRIRDLISEGRINAAVQLCRATDSPIARMIEKGIVRIGRPLSDVATSIENVANLEVAKLEKGIPLLVSISGGAPMIGFLGTVVGLVKAFMEMAQAGSTVDIGILSGGMFVAMITTVGGLLVGIPAYFGKDYLVTRIDRLVFEMESSSIAFMDILNQPVEQSGERLDHY